MRHFPTSSSSVRRLTGRMVHAPTICRLVPRPRSEQRFAALLAPACVTAERLTAVALRTDRDGACARAALELTWQRLRLCRADRESFWTPASLSDILASSREARGLGRGGPVDLARNEPALPGVAALPPSSILCPLGYLVGFRVSRRSCGALRRDYLPPRCRALWCTSSRLLVHS